MTASRQYARFATMRTYCWNEILFAFNVRTSEHKKRREKRCLRILYAECAHRVFCGILDLNTAEEKNTYKFIEHKIY